MVTLLLKFHGLKEQGIDVFSTRWNFIAATPRFIAMHFWQSKKNLEFRLPHDRESIRQSLDWSF